MITKGYNITKSIKEHVGFVVGGVGRISQSTPNNYSPRTETIDRSAWFTLGLLSSTLLAVFFSETMLLPAIPEIMKDFKVPYAVAAWVFSGYMIVAAVMTPIAGKLSDIYGKKKVLLTLLVIYVAGTAVFVSACDKDSSGSWFSSCSCSL